MQGYSLDMLNDNSSNLVEIPVGDVALEEKLVAPEDSTGVVIFAHGSGSSRKSPRNTFVAEKLRARDGWT